MEKHDQIKHLCWAEQNNKDHVKFLYCYKDLIQEYSKISKTPTLHTSTKHSHLNLM